MRILMIIMRIRILWQVSRCKTRTVQPKNNDMIVGHNNNINNKQNNTDDMFKV